jgi:hypothetical protein
MRLLLARTLRALLLLSALLFLLLSPCTCSSAFNLYILSYFSEFFTSALINRLIAVSSDLTAGPIMRDDLSHSVMYVKPCEIK